MRSMESLNRQTWQSPLSVRFYERLAGYVNDGERRMFEVIAGLPQPLAVLDIGIGAGRTTGLFTGLASSYVGIDYTREMVALSRRRFPDRTLHHMDARDLSAFEAQSFDLVMFSFNGLDSMDAAGRADVLREVGRVLKPGGHFIFSTFHRGWIGFRNPHYRRPILSANPVKLGVRVMWYGLGLVRSWRNKALESHASDYAILRHAAHDHGIVVHATAPDFIRSELEAAGFLREASLFDENGVPVDTLTDLDAIEYFYVIGTRA